MYGIVAVNCPIDPALSEKGRFMLDNFAVLAEKSSNLLNIISKSLFVRFQSKQELLLDLSMSTGGRGTYASRVR